MSRPALQYTVLTSGEFNAIARLLLVRLNGQLCDGRRRLPVVRPSVVRPVCGHISKTKQDRRTVSMKRN